MSSRQRRTKTPNWRKILEYFKSATQIGLTATPKETKDISNIDYFGDPIYTYSLKQGIADGFLAPYKVIRIDLDKDILGWQPKPGQRDKYGQLIDDRIYNQLDMDRTLVLDERTKLVAWKITEYLKRHRPLLPRPSSFATTSTTPSACARRSSVEWRRSGEEPQIRHAHHRRR